MAASRVPDFSGPRRVPRPRTPLTADTSSQPEGITRRALLNILEAFFRRPWLHLLPLILMLALGAASAFTGSDSFRSVGTLSVTNESLLSDLTSTASNNAGTFETPATVTARQINELMGTQDFLDKVLAGAGLTDAARQNPVIQKDLVASTGALADGDSIVRVSSTTGQAELSRRLAAATIDAYRAWVRDSYVSQGVSTEKSLTQRVTDRTTDVNNANAALTTLIDKNPAVPIEQRTPGDQLEFQRLQSAADRAQDKLEEAQDSLDAAKLQSAQAAAVVDQRVQVVDKASLPVAPEGRLKKAALTLALYTVIGLLLSLGSVVVAAMLDRTIRVPDDVTAKFGLDVLAVVPNRGR